MSSRASIPRHRLVVCCGMIRSGSTLQYQLACAILEAAGVRLQRLGFLAPGAQLPVAETAADGFAVCKMHHFDEAIAAEIRASDGRAFYSWRDLRDVAASALQKFNVSFAKLWDEQWLQSAVADGENWLRQPALYSTSYERLCDQLAAEIDDMASWLGVSLDKGARDRILAAHGLEAQRHRLAELVLKPGEQYDPHSLMHAGHIRDGAAGRWRRELAADEAKLIEATFREWLQLRGYLSPPPPAPADELAAAAQLSEIAVPHGGWLRHPPGDEVAHLLRQGHYESDLQAFFWLYVRPGHRVLDIGAHFGLYSALARQLVDPDGQTATIEPHPLIQPCLQANLPEQRGHRIMPVALGRAKGQAKLVSEGGARFAHSHVAAGGDFEVQVSTLPAIMAELRWPAADLAKIDTEGFEFEILAGAGEMLGSPKLPVLAIEFSEANLLRVGRTTAQLAATLEQRGYEVCRLDPARLELTPVPADTWPVWFENYFAVLDREKINAHLRGATVERRRVAADIVARGQACQRFKELADLETYRQRADLAVSHREWAERAESRAAELQQLVSRHQAWAERTEDALAKERIAHGEELLKLERRIEELRRLAADHLAWAERTEKLLAAERDLSASHLRWAEQTEIYLAEARAECAQLRKQARTRDSAQSS